MPAKKETPKTKTAKPAATKSEAVEVKTVKAVKSSDASVKPKKSKAALLKVAPEFFYGTGKRKNAIAKVWVFKGKGNIVLNDRDYSEVMNKPSLSSVVLKPMKITGLEGKYDIKISTNGGGIVGQAHACQLGIARAILEMNEAFRKALREEGLLTRDARVKERKKYGCKKARKGFQFRKR